MVLALSASTRAPPAASPAEPPTRSTSAVDATHSRRTAAGEAAGGAHAGVGDGGAAGAGAAATPAPARRGGRFRLLELPVGPPVDLVVGTRYVGWCRWLLWFAAAAAVVDVAAVAMLSVQGVYIRINSTSIVKLSKF